MCPLFSQRGRFSPNEKLSSVANAVNEHAIVQNRKCDFYT